MSSLVAAPLRVLIVGGGFTGSATAHFLNSLQQHKERPLEVELWNRVPTLSGRGPRDPKSGIDYGLQFVTRRSVGGRFPEETREGTNIIDTWIKNGDMIPATVFDDPRRPTAEVEETHHVFGPGGGSQICRKLIGETKTRILKATRIRQLPSKKVRVTALPWQGKEFHEDFDRVILTTGFMLKTIDLDPSFNTPPDINFSRRFCLHIELDSPTDFGKGVSAGAKYVDDKLLRYVRWRDNWLMVHFTARPSFVDPEWEFSDEKIIDRLLNHHVTRLFPDLKVVSARLRRWKYSNLLPPYPEGTHFKLSPSVWLGGEAFADGSQDARRGVFNACLGNAQLLATALLKENSGAAPQQRTEKTDGTDATSIYTPSLCYDSDVEKSQAADLESRSAL